MSIFKTVLFQLKYFLRKVSYLQTVARLFQAQQIQNLVQQLETRMSMASAVNILASCATPEVTEEKYNKW